MAATAVGLGIRLAAVLARPHLVAGGDPAEYLGQANLLVQGKGWIEPLAYHSSGATDQTANLPPLYTMLLALCSLVDKSFLAHRVWSAVLSTVGVALAGLLGDEVAGRRVGVLAAFGVALYPNLWMSSSIGMSETISPVLVTAVLVAAYRMRRQPGRGRAALLGLAIGFAALARDEMAVFALLVLLPLAFGPAARPWRARLALAGAGLATAVAVVGPWVTFNMIRFEHPVLITDRFGVTLASASCDASWYGPLAGYWSRPCALASVTGAHGDESADDPVATRAGLRYIDAHLQHLPALEYDRLGRTFGFDRVRQQIDLDIRVENRPQTWAWVGLWCYYGLVLLLPFGVVVLRRRKVPVFPLAAVAADVVLVTLITYGQTRFRATLEPVLVVVGAVALDAAWSVRAGRNRPAPAGSAAPSGPSSAEPIAR